MGYPIIGTNSNNKFYCRWDAQGWYIAFYVDNQYIGDVSDKRLKKNIKELYATKSLRDIEKLIEIIDKCKVYDFNADNKGDLISVGIMAQDLIEACEKEKIDPFKYEIINKIQYKFDDDTEYYSINYNQYLIMKNVVLERKQDKMQNEIDELRKEIQEIKEMIKK